MLSVSAHLSTLTQIPLLPIIFLLLSWTHQDGSDDVSSVLQAVSVIAASHEAGSVHILLLFVPVANLRIKYYIK